MGFALFESSGIFNPKDYGLNVGDLVHLIVVGGGGGGVGTSNLYSAGTAGGASSFGSILTAEGGLSPSDNRPIEPQPGSYRGAQGVIGSVGCCYSSGAINPVSSFSVYGGGGADGWMPGVCKGRRGLPSTVFAYSHTLAPVGSQTLASPSQDYLGHAVNFAFVDALLSVIPAGNKVAGSGGLFIEKFSGSPVITTRLGIGGAGGIGYGAGGGGGCTSYGAKSTAVEKAGAGGNSGVIAQKDHLLTSLDSVPITVGIGGEGGSGYAGGNGANGCVAIFW